MLLDSPFPLDESPDFPEYLFDVVFIVNGSAEETKTILNSINPVTSGKITSAGQETLWRIWDWKTGNA